MILMDFSYFFSALFRLLGGVWGAVLQISAVSATFSCSFLAFWAGFGVLFWGFLRFQLLFPALFRLFGRVWDAVWGIYTVSATFSCSFSDFWGTVLRIYAISAPQGPLAMLPTYGYCTL